MFLSKWNDVNKAVLQKASSGLKRELLEAVRQALSF